MLKKYNASRRSGLEMKAFLAIGTVVAGGFISGCDQVQISGFDGSKAFAETESLVRIMPRDSGTEGAQRAAVHLEKKLKNLGLDTSVDSFVDKTPFGDVTFHNVLGRLPGKTKQMIVIGSHFDTKSGISPDFQGANDSGSSSGVLLELARVLSEVAPLQTGFLFAFFDGEECRGEYGPSDGLHGSRRLAKQLYDEGQSRSVEAVIILDMIGDKNLTIELPKNSSNVLVKKLLSAAHETGCRSLFSLGTQSVLDDHVPFLLNGMPAIDIIDFEYGSAPGLNDYWHTTEDSMDKLSPQSLQIIGDTVLHMIESFQ